MSDNVNHLEAARVDRYHIEQELGGARTVSRQHNRLLKKGLAEAARWVAVSA